MGECMRGGSDDGKDEEKDLLCDGIGNDIPALLWSVDGLRGIKKRILKRKRLLFRF